MSLDFISDYQVQKNGNDILLGISTTSGAILDILTSEKELFECQRFIEDLRYPELLSVQIGRFGEFSITLNYVEWNNCNAALFINGPDFKSGRNQSAAITINKDELLHVIKKVLKKCRN